MKTTITYILLIIIGLVSCFNNNNRVATKLEKPMEAEPSTVLRIISTNPSYIPNKGQKQQATDLIEKVYPNHIIHCILKDTIEFVDQGQNFDSILCPFCGKNIETEYWQDAMEKADQNQFTDLGMVTPCCHKKTSLNDLGYVRPAGFAKFILSVDEPETEIKAIDVSTLEKALKTHLRVIYAHY